MRFLHNIKKEAKLAVMIILAFSTLALVEKRYGDKLCQDISIKVYDNGTNYFLDKEAVYTLISDDTNEFLIGSSYYKINLKTLETRINDSKYVADAEAYTNLRGQIIIDVMLNIPIARLLLDGTEDFYICQSGEIMPTSDKYTSRVLLISGDYFTDISLDKLEKDSIYPKLLDLISYIYKDEFWKAQISQIDINKSGYITLFPQVTKQYIEFGEPVLIDQKFLKLKVYYKKILPYMGWNHYTKVNVEYKDQIVCE